MAPLNQQPKPCYFLAPTRTCEPEGLIRLGNIIASPELADDPINQSYLAPDPASITTHTERQWNHTITTASNSGKISIWTSFLKNIVGAEADIGFSWDNQASQAYTAKTMKWIDFRPSPQYIRAVVAEEYVDEFIRAKKFREKVYMVTGVMVASGATGTIHLMRRKGLYTHLGVDGTLISGVMTPVSVGTNGEMQWGGNTSTSFGDTDDFVFAFRLRKIKVKKTGEIISKPKVDGALFGLEDGQELLKKRIEDEKYIAITVEGLAEEYTIGSDFRLDSFDAIDTEGQECWCVRIDE